MAMLAAAGVATADPSAMSSLDHIDKISDTRWDVFVYSTSMDRVIELQVLRPAETSVPQPTLYMLNGAGGGEDGANWLKQTDMSEFFADKNVNVVIPVGGYLSYYTDWERDDPTLGRNKWQTFLTQELPPILDDALGANGVNAIGGLSMSAGSVLDLAIQSPGLYRGVASYSGCAQTSDPVSQNFIRLLLGIRGKADADNMWGPGSDPRWFEHDPFVNAEKLRGLELFVSNATGLPGPYELPNTLRPVGSPPLSDQIALGGFIEAVANGCAERLQQRLGDLGIPAQFDLGHPGTHSWLYWQDALRASWPTLERALRD
ncbi:alpha/beta hydrolase family protein [Rhodococcus sp. G-MC3]|uniref:alpha/beta hydrolase n=1 Tax=Rhodococcus sp. G-MC3 TaxID=3046209 RepID=UPI0024BB68B5|nr:alpha/beta hydrolase family protein [Rhodococcus sp. G-MC3]MDJ0393599.1 alpha/beta hydrolase family protein [Rhodococcus sp. G-MC3]